MSSLKCKACGYPLVECGEIVYGPLCRVRRSINPPEIDKETGDWEGMER